MVVLCMCVGWAVGGLEIGGGRMLGLVVATGAGEKTLQSAQVWGLATLQSLQYGDLQSKWTAHEGGLTFL